MTKVLETTLEEIDTAVRQAGFEPGRRLRVSVSYVDEDLEASHRRLNALLDRHPLPEPFASMTEDEIIAMANDEIRAYRAEQRHLTGP